MQLETPRLQLRPLQAADLDAFASLHTHHQVTKYLSPARPLTATESFRLFAQILGHWELRGYGYWAVTERTTGNWLGMTGLWFPLGWPGVELGWRLLPDYWGAGFAFEAATKLCEHARTRLGLAELLSIIHADNWRSVRLAQRLGMTETAKRTLSGTPVLIYGLSLTPTASTSGGQA